MFHTETDPLFEALAALREIDADFVAKIHPAIADDKVARRVRDLRLVVAAIYELMQRDEEPTPETIREEMRVLRSGEGEFVAPGFAFVMVEQDLREDGYIEDADTLAKAMQWMMLMGRSAA